MSISCILTVAGEKIADTAATYAAEAEAVALDGLTVRWGRESRIGQPRASTCSARLALPRGPEAAHILDRLTPGTPISVSAETSSVSQAVTIIAAPAPTVVASTAPVLFAPGPLQAAGSNPGAWDDIPSAKRGALYRAAVEIRQMPPYTTLALRPAYYQGPYADAYVLGPVIASKTTSGAATLSATFMPDDAHAGKWVGLAVIANPLGPTWRVASWTWNKTSSEWTFADFGRVHLEAVSLHREGPTSRPAHVFSGRITDAPCEWDETLNRPVITLTAADVSAEHANRIVSSEPWPAEPVAQRVQRIISAAGLTGLATIIDATPGAVTLGARDVDAQPASSLVASAAISSGSIAWTATHPAIGDYIRFEDLALRHPLYTLTVPASGPAVIDIDSTAAMQIPASQIIRDGLTIERDMTDLATVAHVRWTETSTGDDGKPIKTEHTETVTNPALIKTHGTRSISAPTELTSAADANALAAALLARSAPGGFTIPAAQWAPYATADTADLLNSLGATAFSLNASTILTIDGDRITKTPGPIPGTYGGRATLQGRYYIPTEDGHTYGISVTLTNTSDMEATVNIGAYPSSGLGYRRSIWNPGSKKHIPAHSTVHVREEWEIHHQGDEDCLNIAIYFETVPAEIIASDIKMYETSRPLIDDAAIVTVLDSSSRIGLPIIVTGVDDWIPGGPNIPVYLDGGSYRFSNGAWVMDLSLTRAAVAGNSITWAQAPAALTWNRGGSITFADLSTVHA